MTLNISSVWDLLSYIFECSRSFFRQSQVLQQQNSVGKTVWRVFPLKSEQGQESLVPWGCQTSFDHLKIGQYIFKKHHRTIGLILWFSWNHRCFSKIKETCKNSLISVKIYGKAINVSIERIDKIPAKSGNQISWNPWNSPRSKKRVSSYECNLKGRVLWPEAFAINFSDKSHNTISSLHLGQCHNILEQPQIRI